MTNHRNHNHPATPAARAACRKGLALADDAIAHAIAIKASAPCADCLDAAYDSALENFEDREGRMPTRVEALLEAREYLFDRGCISGCPAHEHLLG